MLFSALLSLLLLQPAVASLSPAGQAPSAQEQKQEKKAQPPATPPGSDPTQPPVKPAEAKPEQDQKQEKKAEPPATPPVPDATQPPVNPEAAKPQGQKPGQKATPPSNNPAEQDATAPPISVDRVKPIVYSFNPTKAAKELEVGNYYMKKSNWAAATLRFEEALKWNPKYSAACLRLGEARENKGELSKAVEAYRKYLELDPNSKKRKDVEKSIGRLQRELQD